MPVDLETLRTRKLWKKCKYEVIIEDGMFDCERCDKMLSDVECLKISKEAFTMVGINERFDLTGWIEIIEVCQYPEKRNLVRKCLKQQLK